ncbi:MAG: UDP-forming cellulose synthase catalytic subunit [Pseudomonadota bacterium]
MGTRVGKRGAFPWIWLGFTGLFAFLAAQQVGLEAQLTFGLTAIAAMLVISTFKLKGPWQHIFMALAAAVVFRYIYWRATQTLPPIDQPIDFLFGGLLFAAEVYSVAMLGLSFFIISDPIERPENPPIGAPESWPTVDVFVPSYNEDTDLVANTLAAALNMDYPRERFTVYLLDDGGTDAKCNQANQPAAMAARARRAEMQKLCADLGCEYIARKENVSAKAGNMNYALQYSTGDLIAVFDADHAPLREFLKRTVGHFQRDARLFLVQTPHFFMNPDPVERNLKTFERMPAENEMFYSVTQKGLDKWNGAFFCGSAAVLSREALTQIGGFSGISITEDAETALELHARGWNSVYVDRAMVAGLQPQTFASFIGQRSRWCQGMLQILMLKRPFMKRGLTGAQKLAYTSSPLFWLFPLSRLIFMAAPALYVFFDLRIYNASFQEFIAYTAIFLISNVLVQNAIFGRVRWPWVSELYEYVQSLYLVRSIASVVMRPTAPSFNVTAKGETLETSRISSLAAPYFIAFAALAATSGWALYRVWLEGAGNELLIVVTAWSVFNTLLAGAALGVVCERRDRRRHYRMKTSQLARLEAAGEVHDVVIDDCSMGGMQVRFTRKPERFPSSLLGLARLTLGTAPDGYGFDVDVRNVSSDDEGPRLGIAIRHAHARDYRAVAALLYGRENSLEAFRRQRQSGRRLSLGSLEFIGWSLFQIVRAGGYLLRAGRGQGRNTTVATDAKPANA